MELPCRVCALHCCEYVIMGISGSDVNPGRGHTHPKNYSFIVIVGSISKICTSALIQSSSHNPAGMCNAVRRDQLICFMLYILNTPNLVSPALTSFFPPIAACRPKPRYRRVCCGGIIPSSWYNLALVIFPKNIYVYERNN